MTVFDWQYLSVMSVTNPFLDLVCHLMTIHDNRCVLICLLKYNNCFTRGVLVFKQCIFQVAQTLFSSPAFAAVPQSRSVSATMPVPSSAYPQRPQDTSSPPRILGHPEALHDEFSEPESSLFDYQQMDELG